MTAPRVARAQRRTPLYVKDGSAAIDVRENHYKHTNPQNALYDLVHHLSTTHLPYSVVSTALQVTYSLRFFLCDLWRSGISRRIACSPSVHRHDASHRLSCRGRGNVRKDATVGPTRPKSENQCSVGFTVLEGYCKGAL